MAAAEPIREKKKVAGMADYYLRQGHYRNYVLILMGVHTALRIGDLLRLRWDDVYNFETGAFRRHVQLVEQKTGKPKAIALHREALRALGLYAKRSGRRKEGRFLFENGRKTGAAISRVQAYRLVRKAALAAGAEGRITCHSLRKTFGYHAWKAGVPVAVIMDIYNHSSFEVTRRYLGVCQDDRDQVYKSITFS